MSSEREIIKEYSNDDMTVIWKPKLCIHSGECVKRLPNVYKPNEKPWITVGNASAEELKEQINACPSGALSYRMTVKEEPEAVSPETRVEVLKDGPLLVHGTLDVTNTDGSQETKKKTTAFCRCGASLNKPYCDGAHLKAGFEG
ncbi:MAG: hypothetical protein HKO90_04940 [Flavobacteriaceae bacterium]|nr:hypothetical protein [Flavobacteriaceae bacterium]